MIFCFITDSSAIDAVDLKDLALLLSDDEQRRLANLKTAKRRTEFIVGRALIKTICAEHFHTTTDKIIIKVRADRAPFLPDYPNWFIGLSHSGKYVMAALADEPIGIDIEQHKNRLCDALMNRLFLNEFPTHWEQLNEIEKQKYFYGLWTQKEAIFKLKCQSEQTGHIYFKTDFKPDGYTTSICSYSLINTDIKKVKLK